MSITSWGNAICERWGLLPMKNNRALTSVILMTMIKLIIPINVFISLIATPVAIKTERIELFVPRKVIFFTHRREYIMLLTGCF